MGSEIERMREDVKKSMKQPTNLEENTFMQQIMKQDRDYYTELDKLILFYPVYKMNNTPTNQTAYTKQLATINGITQNIKTITSSIKDKIETFNRSLKNANDDIDKYTQMYDNLKKYDGDYNQLDMTSKRLLADYINIYSTQRIMIWIKGIILLYLVYRLISAAVKYKQIWIYVLFWIIGVMILMILSYLYYIWQNSVSLPTSATIDSADSKTPTLTCKNTEFGCCPDGVTVSEKNKMNCGCAKSPYGCCDDGTNKNADGTCTPYNPSTLPCNQTEFGCCPDEITISDATGTNCGTDNRVQPPLCSRTQYGCCPDGTSVSNKDRSNCPGSCAFSQYGCCPNGVTISNKDRSNCNVPICTTTRFGCCPNGNTRNQTGSNC